MASGGYGPVIRQVGRLLEGGGFSWIGGGRMMVTDGDLIHIYDPGTGERTHIDTTGEK